MIQAIRTMTDSGKKQSEINARAKIKGEEAHLIVCDCDLS